MKSLLILSLAAMAAGTAFAEADFASLFNGKDLAGWDGDPKLWKVENGIVVGTNPSPEAMTNNSFLIWRGGVVKDFELHATIRVLGDNNSGVQYRSREMPEVAPWVITGYQCDIHPAIEHTGMTYEERGRGIFGLNGKKVMLDPDGALWQLSEHEPVKVDVSQWNEYVIIAHGNHLIHQINGQTTSELFDYDEMKRALEGLLAIQLHRGNANRVEIKELRIKALNDGRVLPFDPSKLPAGAKKIEKPRTVHPQGTGAPPKGAAAPLPQAQETDARLHSDGKGWGLDRAKIIDLKRPRVLLVGDSILNGYRSQVIKALEGKVYVDAWVNPYCQSEHLNKLLAEVLDQGPYDVVHFNMGLHGWQEGRIKPGTFEPLTKAYVQVIKDKLPKARLIWASSTPVTVKGRPTELNPEIDPIIVEHNRMAAKVMTEMQVPVSDFYSLLVDNRQWARGDQFHWTAPAYELLAQTVASSILRELGMEGGK